MIDPFNFITAVATVATAVFMYPAFATSRPLLDVSISDVPNSTRRGSKGEQLQKDGFFVMTVTITATTMPITCRSIDVKGACFPSFTKEHNEILSTESVSTGKKPFLLMLRPNESRTLRFLVRPDDIESGTLEVVIPFSRFRRPLRAHCEYQRTHYIGE